MKDFYEVNAYYRRNPPKVVLDDLGIDQEIYVPLPAKYKRLPCECGIIHKWENPSTFEIVEFLNPEFLKKVKRCNICKDILYLEFLEKMYND